MRYARLTAAADGGSVFDDYEHELEQLRYVPTMPPMTVASPRDARQVHFVLLEPGTFQPWHTSPRPHYAITLSGEVEIRASSGEARNFPTGQLYLALDTRGQGHETRVVGDQTWVAAVISLPE